MLVLYLFLSAWLSTKLGLKLIEFQHRYININQRLGNLQYSR